MCQYLLTITVRNTRQRGKWHPQPCEERFEVRRRRRAAPIFFGLEETCNLGGQTLTSVHSDVEKEADLDVQSRLLPMQYILPTYLLHMYWVFHIYVLNSKELWCIPNLL